MEPSSAMGTFLRVWRAEWAGLSRAQVAVALSAGAKMPVATHVVRHWEQGQPPGSTRELEALLEVMQGHGLQPREAGQFRQAVFAACVDRQYPELFEGGDFAYRRDVDEAAHALFEAHWTAGGANIVHLVGMAESVARVVLEGKRAGLAPGQSQRQFVALCYLRALIGDAHDYANRPEAAAAAWAQNHEILQRHFARGGLEWPLTPLYARVREAYSRSYPGNGPSYPKAFGSPVWSVRLLELADEAEAEGDTRLSVQAFFHALGGLDHYRHPGLHETLARASDYVGKAETAGDSDVVRQAHVELCTTHIRHGDLEQAEKHLAATEHMRTGSALRQAMWYCNLGRLRLAQGDHSAAQEALELALRAARRTPQGANWEGVILHFLGLCERGEVSARQRSIHQVKPAPGAHRGRGRATQRKPPSR
jgi:uncharacterized protein (DUF2267 family)